MDGYRAVVAARALTTSSKGSALMAALILSAQDSLIYNGCTIQERDEMLSLTDMWRAADKPQNQRPVDWLGLASTESFAEHIAAVVGKSHDDIIQTLRGNDAGTWAHWQIGMAYAKYLSHDFHAWCNQVVRDHMEKRQAPIQSTAVMVATSSRLDETLNKLAALIYDGHEKHSREIGEVRQDVRAINSRLTGIEARIEEVAKRGRRRVKDSVKGDITRHTHLLGDRCPCCGVRTVVVDGRPAPHAEFDHFYANSAPDADHVWLICSGCHAELTRHVTARDERNAEFQAFQAKRRRLPGSQLTLLEGAA